MTDKLQALQELIPELEKYPAQVQDNFNKAISEMPEALSDEQRSDWLKQGIAIAAQTVRSWEAAAHFFQVSPKVIASMPIVILCDGWRVDPLFVKSPRLWHRHILKQAQQR